jgi:hypothetical protein
MSWSTWWTVLIRPKQAQYTDRVMRRIAVTLILGLPLVLLAQCGLERSLAVWSIPAAGSTSTTGIFSFRTASDHDDDLDRVFLGYEIYYKIMATDSFPTNLTNANELAANGFKKLHLATDTWEPPQPATIPVITTNAPSKGNIYQVIIDFNTLEMFASKPSIAIDPDDTQYWPALYVRRDIEDHADTPGVDNYGNYKRFYEVYAGETDIDPALIPGPPSQGTQLYPWIALYVFAYGRSIATNSFWQEIKSPLRYLPAQLVTVIYEDGNP